MSYDLNDLRKQIDAVDRDLLDCLERRMAISRQIGVCKREIGKDILDDSRESYKP